MKNKLTDLNNHLFAQLERLSDEDTKGAELLEEINRAHAVAGIAKQLIAGATVALKAQIALSEREIDESKIPPMLSAKNG